jgi:hypothetical protein
MLSSPTNGGLPVNFDEENDAYNSSYSLQQALQRVKGWQESTDAWQTQDEDSSGLNLAGNGTVDDPRVDYSAASQPAQETGGVPTWVKALKGIGGAVEAFGAGFQGREPLFLKQQALDQQQEQLKQVAKYRSDMLANQIRAQEETKRQHNWGIAEKLITTGNMGALEEFGKQFPDVLPIVQGVSKQHLSSLPVLAKGGYLPEEVVNRVMNPKPGDAPMTPAELSMHVKLGMENWQADIKENAKQVVLSTALNTPKEQRRPHQQLLVDEHEKKLAVQDADIELKQAQAKKALHEAEVGTRPDRSLANKVHQSMFGVPFEQGTEESQAAALKSYFAGSAQGHQQVTQAIPVGQTGKAQEFRDPVSGQAAPSWATPQQLSDLGFVNIEPSQVQTVNQIRNVDAAMKEIHSAGSSLLRKETGSGNLADIPLGFLQIPIVKLIKKYAGDPDAQVLQSAIARVSPALARLGGDTGNIALAEQEMYQKAVFSDADTLESFSRKIQSINDAQARTRSSLGFVPDEKSYMRRLIIQGKTDDQIKAIVAERKRFQ